jgi:hypothetical protein
VPPGPQGAREPQTRSAWPLLAHLTWSALVLLGSALAIGSGRLLPFVEVVLGLAALLYVAGLSAVLAWVRSLRRRGLADVRAGRDWYLLAALVGLPISPLLAFTIASALR